MSEVFFRVKLLSLQKSSLNSCVEPKSIVSKVSRRCVFFKIGFIV
jgi:hypothetical protein